VVSVVSEVCDFGILLFIPVLSVFMDGKGEKSRKENSEITDFTYFTYRLAPSGGWRLAHSSSPHSAK
jgi:hypothetical protein